ncbi:2OG-Fe dioxygenase family protein [Arenimonas sp.]|uniref:2OG-Fe dioxygenase family protein n=1 Tax=Arenimonas sp. TaxID=1872635 RepID=UPI0039E3EE97
MSARPDSLAARIAGQGYAFVPAEEMRLRLGANAFSDWPAFVDSWNRLETDTYMADQGRYRRRRHAVFRAGTDDAIVRAEHQPHYQGLDYNPLNGGIERWFEPIEPSIGDGASLRGILRWCRELFDELAGAPTAWRIETHQFRIEAQAGAQGKPTPEGMHRDGVDYVLVLLVRRENIASGTTLIGTKAEGFFSSFTLVQAFDAALVDDHRVFHGVTPVEALEPAQPAHRDVLVVTFRRTSNA